MALTAQTSAGLDDADTYADLTYMDAYWAARPHRTESSTWSAATTANKEGAAREARQLQDTRYGPMSRGVKMSEQQSTHWPVSGGYDDNGYPLPPIHTNLKDAQCELAVKCVGGTALQADLSRGGMIKNEKLDVIETEYFEGASPEKAYPLVDNLMKPLITNSSAYYFSG